MKVSALTYLILILVFYTTLTSFAMEHESLLPQGETFEVISSDSQSIVLPLDQALRYDLFKSKISFSGDYFYRFNDNKPYYESREMLHPRGFMDKLDLSATILKKLFELDQNPTIHIEKNDIIPLFRIAELLGCQQQTLRRLTLEGKKRLEKINRPKNMRGQYYLNSLESLGSATRVHSTDVTTFDLSDLHLDRLAGIHRISHQLALSITHIDLNDNELNKLKVTTLLGLFPNLNHISARNNDFHSIQLPSLLPDHFALDLQCSYQKGKSSKIKKITPFKAGQGCLINVKGYKLSTQARKILENAVKVPLHLHHQHRIRALKESLLRGQNLRGFLIGFGFSTCIALHNFYVGIKYILKNAEVVHQHGSYVWGFVSELLQNKFENDPRYINFDSMPESLQKDFIDEYVAMIYNSIMTIRSEATEIYIEDIPKESKRLLIGVGVGTGLIACIASVAYYYWTTGYNNNVVHKYNAPQLHVDSKEKFKDAFERYRSSCRFRTSIFSFLR